MTHDPRHAAWLEELSTARPGERADLERSLGDCGECRRMLVLARRDQQALDAAGEWSRELVREARAVEGAPGEERVDEVLRALAGVAPAKNVGPRPVVAPPRRWYAALAALAAALLVGWYFVRTGAPVAPEDPTHLGSRSLEIVRPRGAVRSFAPFEWTIDDARARTFEVFVYASDDSDRILARSGRAEAARWSPEEAEQRSWGETIRWEVRAYAVDGRLLGARSAQASLSPP